LIYKSLCLTFSSFGVAMEQGDILFDKYELVRNIGSGSFGDVWKGKNISNGDIVAIKIEKVEKAKTRLESEKNICQQLRGEGVPEVFHYGNIEDGTKALVMSYLGPSLENLFDFCNRKLSFKTIAMIGIQLMDRLEHIHSKGILHRDIKPDNFLIGIGENRGKIFMVDFGLSKSFRENENHISYRSNKNFTGTYRYSSIRNHRGVEQSRRDDLESVGYMLVYFAKGVLPWQGLKIEDKAERNRAIYKKKRTFSASSLCEGLPSEFYDYIRYARMLRFTSRPDYNYLRSLFWNILQTNNDVNDCSFDWNEAALKLEESKKRKSRRS
jgi:casein kinase I family protein HRR25